MASLISLSADQTHEDGPISLVPQCRRTHRHVLGADSKEDGYCLKLDWVDCIVWTSVRRESQDFLVTKERMKKMSHETVPVLFFVTESQATTPIRSRSGP